MRIILISGKAEHGKTTTAELLRTRLEALGLRVLKMAYGDYVKFTAKQVAGWDGVKDEKGRGILQWWATDHVRAIDATFWTDAVVRLASVVKDLYDYIIIDDLRFPNEIECWGEADVVTVRVTRIGHKSKLTKKQLRHISETALDHYRFAVRIRAHNEWELGQAVDKKLKKIRR